MQSVPHVDSDTASQTAGAAASSSYQRYVVVMLLIVYVFNQVDRLVFAILMEPIRHEFALSDTQIGFLAGPALALFYAAFGIPIARWADRSHRVNIMSAAVLIWSTIVLLSAATTKFWQLALARIGVGIGEAGFTAIAQSVITDYHTPAERTRAMAIFMLAIPIGGVLSNLAGGWINEAYGWRAVLCAAGVPGIVLAVLLKWTVREPVRSQVIAPTVQSEPFKRIVATLLMRRSLRHLAIAMALLNLIGGGVLGWMLTFFVRTHALGTGELGAWFAFNTGVGGALGIWLSGAGSRRFGLHDERSQSAALAASAVATGVLLAAALLCPSAIGALSLMFFATVAVSYYFAPSFALLQGLSSASSRATTVAIVIFLQIICSGVVGVQLTGVLSDALSPFFERDSLRYAMLAMLPIALWAAFHFRCVAGSVQTDLAELRAAEARQGATDVRAE